MEPFGAFISKDAFQNFNMSKDEIKESIHNFIMKNSNYEGLDLSKVYLAHLINSPFPVKANDTYQQNYGINCPINLENDPKKMTLVYIVKSQGKHDHVFIDLFNQTLLQSTCVNITGAFALMPEIRKGVTVSRYKNLQDFLGIDRISYDKLELMFNALCEMDETNDLSDDALSKLLILETEKSKTI